MGKHWCYFLFMLWFCYLMVSAILLFTKGFLLTRVTQKNNSTCLDLSEISCPNEQSTFVNIDSNQCTENEKISHIVNNVSNTSHICLPRKSKVVLLIIDALRYDFTVFNETNQNAKAYQNKLPIIHEIRKKYPDHSRLYKFIADPPTTTMQRIKGLTTGSLPTFIDAGSNFATYEINEDNIIDQLIASNRGIIFMGDDTWTGLYTKQFKRLYPFPSLIVRDLDTVDYGVISVLYDEIKQNDWTLIVGHFLGVDHCGHIYGPNHPEMTRKLNEMNSVIKKTIAQIDEDTLLLVIGDHGMTSTGDHGGESDDEITSALFMYSKQRPFAQLGEQSNTVKQVDLVPTLASILGIPVPFSNLGTLILDALPSTNSSHFPDWKLGLHSVWANAQQMMIYIDSYSKTSDVFNRDILQQFHERFSMFKRQLTDIETREDFELFYREVNMFLVELRQMCEEVWVQFDSLSMTRGLLLLFLSMFFVFVIADGIPIERLSEIFNSSFLSCSYFALFLSAFLASCLYYYAVVDHWLATIFFLTGVTSQFMLVMLVIQNWELISLNWYDRSKKERIPNLICRLVLIFTLSSFFSNSFVVEESFALLFLLNSVILMSMLTQIKKKNDILSKFKLISIGIGVLCLVRISTYFWYCRPEEYWCFSVSHDFSSTRKTETTKLQWILSVICLGLFVTVTKVWLRNCGNLNGYAINVTLAKYIPTVLVVSAGGFWVLNRLPLKDKMFKPWQANLLAWIVYSFSSIGIFATAINPLSIFILPNNQLDVKIDNNLIPQLFNHFKGLFSEKQTSKDQVPIVCGFGTVFSATYIIIGIYLTLVIALLLGDAAAPSIVIAFFTLAFILIITSIIRLERIESIDQLFNIPNSSLLIWTILTQYFFYGSGHQASFPNIAWDAAFVGTSGIFTNNFIPGLLIIINTFSSHILMGFLMPLLVIAPFTVSVMAPSLLSKKNLLLQGDNLRGELLLYEKDDLILTSVFILSCKYMMCHGIRVFASMLSATIHCRHLMVWGIFAPKFIFEAIGMMVTLVVVNLSYLLLIRINYKVDRLIISLTKKFS